MSYLQLTRLPQYTFIVPGPEGERKTKGGRIKEIRKTQRMSEEKEKGGVRRKCLLPGLCQVTNQTI